MALGAAPLAAAQPKAPQGATDPAARPKSPPLSVRTLDGETLEVANQRGKVVLVDVMSTTCPSCKLASEGIQRIFQQLGGKGFLPVAVAVDQQAAGVLAFYRNVYRLTFPVGTCSRDEILAYLQLPAGKPLMVPTLVLIDKRGRISATQVGWTGEQELSAAVRALLGET
ncbi:MAG: TlpA family protein disulfide reductase [Bryobacterales bacterium]|nr:TlpA family protein disulfide reductase [Bryobacterales bacterium]